MLDKIKPDFYEDAKKGVTTAPIWIACALCIAAFYYVPHGFITSIVYYLAEKTEIIWLSPYAILTFQTSPYLPEATRALFVNLFLSWVPTTIFLATALWFVQKHLRERPLKNIITITQKFRWRRVLAAIIVFVLLSAIFWFLKSVWVSGNQPSLLEASSTPRLNSLGLEWVGFGRIFWLSLPFLLIFIPLDAALQEMVFRGFGDQALSNFTSSRIVAFCISAALFALWHFGNLEMYNGFLPYFGSLFLFGLLMSVLTSMDGGLEAAIGVHAASNLFFFLIVGTDNLGLAPTWLLSSGDPHFTLSTLLIDGAFYFLIAFILAYWRYGTEE